MEQEPLKPAPESTPKKAEEKKAEPAKPQRPANCSVCNKFIKEKWYYRNGAYYCSKGCFKQSKKKLAEEKKKSEASA